MPPFFILWVSLLTVLIIRLFSVQRNRHIT
nr:MAG TPA: hypothetical protein [Caudoviricetes sp.]